MRASVIILCSEDNNKLSYLGDVTEGASITGIKGQMILRQGKLEKNEKNVMKRQKRLALLHLRTSNTARKLNVNLVNL